MPDFTTETRTYVGEPNTVAVDGYAGFRVGQQYELAFLTRADKSVVVRVQNFTYAPGTSYLYMSQAQFERWWRK